jgi:outer membrane protein assembly factor BamB
MGLPEIAPCVIKGRRILLAMSPSFLTRWRSLTVTLLWTLSSIGVFADTPIESSSPGNAQWNQFRGPNGSGRLAHARPPLKPDEAHLAWKAPLPYGQSSPVVLGDRLFLTAVENDDTLVTLALNKRDGRILWKRKAPQRPLEKVHQANSPASPSAYADAHRVVVYFGSYGLLCYDHDGDLLWTREIPSPKSLYGTSTSPIGFEDTIILVVDNDLDLPDSKFSQSKVLAFSKHTGERVWETARPFNRSGWSTPAILPHEESPELVVLGHGRVYGYDAATGAEKWFVNGFSRETIAVPVVGEDRVFVSASMLGGVSDEQPDRGPFWEAMLPFDANGDQKIGREEITEHFTFPLRPDLPLGHPGFGIPIPKDPAKRKERQEGFFRWVDKNQDGFWTREELINHLSFNRGKPNLMAIRPGGSGDVTESHVAWALHRNIPEIPSPVYYDGRLYLVRDGGVLSAVDATDGKVIYRKRLGASGHYSPSPIVANDHLYVVSNEGVLSVVKAGDEYERIHQVDLEATIAATPALDEDTLYVRTDQHLVAYRRTRE